MLFRSYDAYSRINILIDADKESANEYNESVEDITTSAWLNEDSNSETDNTIYIDSLLDNRKTRTNEAQNIIECEVEMKDSNITTGERSEEHTSELQSHSFISYAVFCLKKKT